jgi:hypothetical protein
MEKARSEGFSDRASGMETMGLEPTTSALRTHETVVLTENQSEVTATDVGVCPTVCPGHAETGSESTEDLPAEIDFAAVLLMIERLPLSDEQKADAIRRLLNRDV